MKLFVDNINMMYIGSCNCMKNIGNYWTSNDWESAGLNWWFRNYNAGKTEIGMDKRLQHGILHPYCWRSQHRREKAANDNAYRWQHWTEKPCQVRPVLPSFTGVLFTDSFVNNHCFSSSFLNEIRGTVDYILLGTWGTGPQQVFTMGVISIISYLFNNYYINIITIG